MILGNSDAAAASMLSVSRSLITKIRNRKLSITTITAKGLAANLAAAWPLMMDQIPPTLGDDWRKMPSEEELAWAEAAIADTEVPELMAVGYAALEFNEAAE